MGSEKVPLAAGPVKKGVLDRRKQFCEKAIVDNTTVTIENNIFFMFVFLIEVIK